MTVHRGGRVFFATNGALSALAASALGPFRSLLQGQQLEGFIVLLRDVVDVPLNWEDHDILKTVEIEITRLH